MLVPEEQLAILALEAGEGGEGVLAPFDSLSPAVLLIVAPTEGRSGA